MKKRPRRLHPDLSWLEYVFQSQIDSLRQPPKREFANLWIGGTKDVEAQRTKVQQHIQDQARFQGKRVKVTFLREEDGHEIFYIQSAGGTAELSLSRAALSLTPAHLWEIDERIAASLSSI